MRYEAGQIMMEREARIDEAQIQTTRELEKRKEVTTRIQREIQVGRKYIQCIIKKYKNVVP